VKKLLGIFLLVSLVFFSQLGIADWVREKMCIAVQPVVTCCQRVKSEVRRVKRSMIGYYSASYNKWLSLSPIQKQAFCALTGLLSGVVFYKVAMRQHAIAQINLAKPGDYKITLEK